MSQLTTRCAIDSMFVRHTPCPKCGSKDNRAEYSDGHTFCFGCRAYTPATHRSTTVEKDPVDIPDTFVNELPDKNKNWLRQYLTDDQIDEFFVYSPSMDRHVYIHYGADGTYWEGRVVGDATRSKTISKGQKPFSVWGKWKETGVVCLVEDIVSAIKLSDYIGVVCLHGSTIPHKLYGILGQMPGIKHVIIWLDKDKLSAASVYTKKFQFWGVSSSLISTLADPKAHTHEEIKRILQDAVTICNKT